MFVPAVFSISFSTFTFLPVTLEPSLLVFSPPSLASNFKPLPMIASDVFLRVFYVYCCVWSIISCSVKFVQECIASGCTSFVDSRTNVVYDGVATSCVTSCILKRYDNVTCRNIITSRTIKVCCVRVPSGRLTTLVPSALV